jgi:dolichyl-phosphate-mannose-protein mannosyltransferase/tetratricopeptide repeat protein
MPSLRPLVVWSVIVALIILAVIRSSVATRTDGFAADEAYHITAGVSYVKLRDFRLNPEHPPLVKIWVGAFLAPEFQLPPLPTLSDKFAEREFNERVVFLQNDPDRVQQRARVAMFCLNALLLLFLAVAVSRTLSNVAALGTIAFLAIDPTVAAHLPVVLTDLSVALLAATAILFAVQAFRSGRWFDVSLAALALGLTLGAKHSGLIALVAVALGGIVKVVATKSNRRRMLVVTLLILFGALIVLWGLYGFRNRETASGAETFNRPLALKVEDVRSRIARPTLRALERSHLLPRAYVWGLADTVRAGMEGRGIPVYFLGNLYTDRGPIYFFPVVLATKLPLGLLTLSLSGLVLFWKRKFPDSWDLPGAGLLLLAVGFLFALARGVSYGGVRHALPVLMVLGVFGGMVSAWALCSASRLARILVTAALVVGAISAVPRLRPWEYFNETVGGPERAYFYFGDEGVDMGQRTRDLVSYYRGRLVPSGEVPYLLYPMAGSEQKRRELRTRASYEMEEDVQSIDVSGVFLVTSTVIFQDPRYRAFSQTSPVERIGNLLIYRGTFHLPWLRETKLLLRARRLLAQPQPDFEKAEAQLREVLTINPNNFGVLLQLGNLKLRRGERNEAASFYERARKQVSDDAGMSATLSRQIERLSSAEPIERLATIRDPREE